MAGRNVGLQIPAAGVADVFVMLYDGGCGLCSASVQFILRFETGHSLRFAPLAGTTAAEVRGRHPHLAGVDSMVWVEHYGDTTRERVYIRSAAVLKAARYLGGLWRFASVGWVVPAPLRDLAYNLVARHRHWLMGRREPDFPSAETRGRFLE